MKNILFEIKSQIATITLNRPDTLNALSATMMTEILEALEQAKDPKIRVVVIKANGRAFCAGGDIKMFKRLIDGEEEFSEELLESLHKTALLIRNLEKPVLACVQGPVAGAGASLALACDLILASEDLTMIFAYAQVGLNPDGGSTFILPRHVGLKRATELFLFCTPIKSKEALEDGLVNWVVPEDKFEDKIHEIAQKLKTGPTKAYAKCKKLLNQSHQNDLMTQLDLEGQLIIQSSQTMDFKEGVRAFVAKRNPEFKGE